jgi:hypothetical protein
MPKQPPSIHWWRRAHTLGFHGPDGLHLHASVKERSLLVKSLDVRKAEVRACVRVPAIKHTRRAPACHPHIDRRNSSCAPPAVLRGHACTHSPIACTCIRAKCRNHASLNRLPSMYPMPFLLPFTAHSRTSTPPTPPPQPLASRHSFRMCLQCYIPADKDMILADVRATAGSEAAFNERLKLQLLLQPLSYAVDLRQLRRGAPGAAWDWGRITAWLDEGDELGAGRQDGRDEEAMDEEEESEEASGDEEDDGEGGRETEADKEERRRAAGASPCLCVLGGPGEGKSTLAAALLADAQLGQRVHAYHLCKFSDQRRREPKRVLETLLFSLAQR